MVPGGHFCNVGKGRFVPFISFYAFVPALSLSKDVAPRSTSHRAQAAGIVVYEHALVGPLLYAVRGSWFVRLGTLQKIGLPTAYAPYTGLAGVYTGPTQ